MTVNNSELADKFYAIRSGDKAAFDEIYKDLKIPIYTIIFRITWDKQTSEELLHDLFIKLFLSPPDHSVKNLRAYIFQMAHNLAVNSVKRQQRHISLDEIPEPVCQPPSDFALRMDIGNALKIIPAQECQIVTLHIIGELKFREISEIMQIPLGTVLWKYQKAIGKLQKIISGGTL